mmetsp:Transcript_87461/g.183045  ORF Transcript_87461/g.183045 Transcript_87461/m.183045 type:complete len:249 (-) Transcript_87461:13-759(-)
MNPGRSSLVEVSFFMAAQRSSVCLCVASSVRRPRMTSTKGITGTGFMKCMPMKRSGRSRPALNFVIEMELVFVARMLEEGRLASKRALNTARLMSSSSDTASTTKSKSATPFMAAASSKFPYLMRPTKSWTSDSANRPLLTSLAAQSWTNLLLRSRLGANLSNARTSAPAWRAATIAMPVPIWPQPTTPILFTPLEEELLEKPRTESPAALRRLLSKRRAMLLIVTSCCCSLWWGFYCWRGICEGGAA